MTTKEDRGASLRRRAVLAMAVSAIGLAGGARAQPGGGLVDLAVVDRETGQPMRVWRHRGRLFVAGDPGARYSLRVTNNTGGRVLVVMSVDGVNIVTGESAAYGQRGYVFGPYQSYDVTGWRKSSRAVAAFTFASLPQSYASRTGRPGDVGVIGIAAFEERLVQPQVSSARPQGRARDDVEPDLAGRAVGRRAQPAPAAPLARSDAASAIEEVAVTAQRREEKLGTAHGAREWSVATTVAFERATRHPQLVRRIEYDTYDRLVASGVVRPAWAGRPPRPFPGSGPGYVPDPPGEY